MALQLVQQRYTAVPPKEALLKGTGTDTFAEFIELVAGFHRNARAPTAAEKELFNRVREEVGKQFEMLCEATMLQEFHALKDDVPEERLLKETIKRHDDELGNLMNALFEEWVFFKDQETRNDESDVDTTHACVCSVSDISDAAEAYAAQERKIFDEWFETHSKHIIAEPPLVGGSGIGGLSGNSDAKASSGISMAVGSIVPLSARIHPSTGLNVDLSISSSSVDVLRRVQTKDPLRFEAQERGLCGGDGRTITWYVEAIGCGSGTITLTSSWRGDTTQRNTLHVTVK